MAIPPTERERPREYPILFSGPMVRALLAGTKTQTRRLDKRWMKVKAGDRLWVRETWRHGWASRLTLTATADAREERLQGITPRDARAEGVPFDGDYGEMLTAYVRLWDEINPKVPWSSNPEVVVLTFARLP